MENVNQLVDHLFRHESGKMIAVLTRLFGFPNYDTARDIVQETMLAALQQWSRHAVPDNPVGWLTHTAKNKTLDLLRRQKTLRQLTPELTYQHQTEEAMQSQIDVLFLDDEIQDSQLRMIFACCHAALPVEAQITLILRTLCGLTIPEISQAFLSNDENINKRLYRAKEKIRSQTIALEVPTGNELLERLEAVLKAIYLLFNEGYYSKNSGASIRYDLCDEAMRLASLLTQNSLTNLPKVGALLSLMCFQASRLEARQDNENQIILLQNQDRNKWNTALIQRGQFFLNTASKGNELSSYHLEAAIASYHAQAESFEKTNWQAILSLYGLLEQVAPSAVVSFNKAIATGFAQSPKRGIEALLALKGFDSNHYYHVALGDFYTKMQDFKTAKNHYETAIKNCTSQAERKLIWDKMEAVNG